MKKQTETRVTIDCTEEQSRIIVAALDLLERMHLGQWYVLTERLKWRDYHEYHVAQDVLRAAAGIYTRLPPGSSYGIHSPEIDTETHDAADMKAAIRHELWKAQPKGERSSASVDAHPPAKHAQAPLPTVTVRVAKKGEKQ
jgi:hypothetical protein